jgi:hypothetical protein
VLERVWGADWLSWWLTRMLHVFADRDMFDTRINQNALDRLCGSQMAHAALAAQQDSTRRGSFVLDSPVGRVACIALREGLGGSIGLFLTVF